MNQSPNQPEKVVIGLAADARELTYRTGDAAPIRERKPQVIAGTLSAPWAFLENKQTSYEPLTSHVEVSRDEARVTLYLNEADQLGDVITGRLVLDTETRELGINAASKLFTVPELRKVLKSARRFFADPDAHGALLRGLEQFSATITRKLEDHKDTRGNSKKATETAVGGVGLPESFVLKSRIFKNEEPRSYRVELGYDVTDAGGVVLFLESVELLDLIHEERERLLKVAAQPLIEWGCSVVYLS